MEPDTVHRHCDVLNCSLNMCHLQAMIAHADGLVCRIPQDKKTWCMQGVQAAWRLGRWDLMDEYLPEADKSLVCSSSENSASFDIGLAKIFKAMMNTDQFMVAEKIAQSKQAMLVPLAAAGMDSYMCAYPYIVKLHMLCELEDFNSLRGDESFLDKTFSVDDPKFLKLTTDWDNRLRCTQSSMSAREPLLAFQRMFYNLSHMNSQVGNCWLQYAKLCCLAGHYEAAHRAILEADASGAPNVHMEKAKHLWNIRNFVSHVFSSHYFDPCRDLNHLIIPSHLQMLSIIHGSTRDLPTYQWLTVLSQLISRICHQNGEVVKTARQIITSVLQACPQQALWMMAAVSKSTVSARKDAATQILNSAKKGCRKGGNVALFNQFPSLIEHLIKLCFHPGQPKAKAINISTEFSSLKRMMPLGIILPVQQSLTVTLPSYDSRDCQGSRSILCTHLTRGVFLGSGGVARPFLCKPKDGLRKEKDARVMEFNAVINRLLSKVPESRRRRKLYIRTLAVVPLTEDCGLNMMDGLGIAGRVSCF
ncbi:hypothetical protein CFC21_007708 [Triticum aestivum]|uniref:Uncharacterized protein n=2 Tax=Triticum aestivum TaxID=4565 RepID=A0A3B5Z156_WHEAT|nr:hypothetical protein CFC21_007708 [Triticum aestivum]